MRTVNEKIPGQILTEDLQLNGIAEGNLTVGPGCSLQLNGTVAGDLIVEERGRADVNGVVTGTVRNRGGTVVVHGVVQGAVSDSGSTVTEVMPSAIISGVRR